MILIYLCMNAIFSKTMQDTETQISQFIVEGTANSNMVSMNKIFAKNIDLSLYECNFL